MAPCSTRFMPAALVSSLLLLAPLAGGGALVPQAQAQSCTIASDGVKSGTVHWGVKQSYRNYLHGNVAKGGWKTTGVGFEGTETGSDSAFVFSAGSGGNASATSVTVPLQGSIQFYGHDYGDGPLLDMTLTDMKLQVDGTTGYFITDYVSYTSDMTSHVKGEKITGDDQAIAEISWSTVPDFSAGTVSLEGATTLTGAGSDLFLAYQPGESLDTLKIELACSGSSGKSNSGGGSRSYVNLPDYTDGLGILKEANDTMFALGTVIDTSMGMLDDAEKFYARVFGRDEISAQAAQGQPVATGGTPATATASGAGAGSAPAGTSPAAAAGGTASGTATDTAARTATGTPQAAGAAGASGAAPASAPVGGDVCTSDGTLGVTAANARWGIKRSFQTYIRGSIAKGKWDLSGVGYDNNQFLFAGQSGAVNPEARTGSVMYPGSLVFTGHGGVLDLRISDVEVQFNGEAGSLLATVVSNDTEGKTTDFGRTTLADLSFTSLDVTDGAVNGQATVHLTESGSRAFADFYPAGTELDPISFDATLGGAANCAAGQGASVGGAAPANTAGGNAAAAARLAAAGATGSGEGAAGSGGFGDSSSSQLDGGGDDGGFRITSAGGQQPEASTLNTALLLIIAAMVVVGGTLTRFVQHNPQR